MVKIDSLQERFNFADQKLGFDRFGNIIIPSGLKTGNLRIILSPRGQKSNHRILHVRKLSYLLTCFYPIHLRHHYIQEHKVRPYFSGKS